MSNSRYSPSNHELFAEYSRVIRRVLANNRNYSRVLASNRNYSRVLASYSPSTREYSRVIASYSRVLASYFGEYSRVIIREYSHKIRVPGFVQKLDPVFDNYSRVPEYSVRVLVPVSQHCKKIPKIVKFFLFFSFGDLLVATQPTKSPQKNPILT
jgi:hypothetical protein